MKEKQSSNKVRMRMNSMQQTKMLELLSQKIKFKSGFNEMSIGKSQKAMLWENVARECNLLAAHSSQRKTVLGWKRAWIDLKSKSKKKVKTVEKDQDTDVLFTDADKSVISMALGDYENKKELSTSPLTVIEIIDQNDQFEDVVNSEFIDQNVSFSEGDVGHNANDENIKCCEIFHNRKTGKYTYTCFLCKENCESIIQFNLHLHKHFLNDLSNDASCHYVIDLENENIKKVNRLESTEQLKELDIILPQENIFDNKCEHCNSKNNCKVKTAIPALSNGHIKIYNETSKILKKKSKRKKLYKCSFCPKLLQSEQLLAVHKRKHLALQRRRHLELLEKMNFIVERIDSLPISRPLKQSTDLIGRTKCEKLKTKTK